MVFFKQNQKFLQEVGAIAKHWTKNYSPSETVPVSGVYRFKVCVKEITSNENDSFPPQNNFDLKLYGYQSSEQILTATDMDRNNNLLKRRKANEH
ncbi:hypothetical protein [Pantoea vagans]|uniref:hypothetical protein n=1 Tax=Pantoea vagans TaxID=470934 RepID=UPI003B012EB6